MPSVPVVKNPPPFLKQLASKIREYFNKPLALTEAMPEQDHSEQDPLIDVLAPLFKAEHHYAEPLPTVKYRIAWDVSRGPDLAVLQVYQLGPRAAMLVAQKIMTDGGYLDLK